MYKNRQNSLRFKIWLGFVLVNSILISAVVMSIWQIHRISTLATHFVTEEKQVLNNTVNLRQKLATNIINIQNLLLTSDEKFKTDIDELWQKDITPGVNTSYTLSKKITDTSFLREIQQTQKALETIQANQASLLEEYAKGNTENYKKQLSDVIAQSQVLSNRLEIFSNTKHAQSAQEIKEAENRIAYIMLVDFILLSIGIILSFILAIILMRSISVPVKRFVSFSNDLSKGKLDQMLNIQESTEYVELSNALNQVVITLRDLADIAENVAVGDFSQRVIVKSKEDRLAISVNKMMDNFEKIVEQADNIAEGKFTTEIKPQSPHDKIGRALQNMTKALRLNKKNNDEYAWIQQGMTQLANQLSNIDKIEELCNVTLSEICRYIDAGMGAIYRFDDKQSELYLGGSYAYTNTEDYQHRFKLGEGIIGQSGKELKPTLLTHVVDSSLKITSATLHIKPKNIYISPLIYENKLIGVMEICSYKSFSHLELDFLVKTSPLVAGHLRTAEQHLLTENLLGQIEEKARELEQASRYKSEFLANMSHELRTPLNSLIILTKLMLNNKEKNLNQEQMDSLKIVHKNGEILLLLINDILDLSKVEAGKIEITIAETPLSQIAYNIESQFTHVVEQKNIGLKIVIDDNLPQNIYTDEHRLAQILRNLVSNAIKFTEKGSVTLSIKKPTLTDALYQHALTSENTIIFEVTDSGIGISEEAQKYIFEPFRQADGSTTRKYGGTGLGLSICNKLADLLGGFLQVKSQMGVGSTFTLYLPLRSSGPQQGNQPTAEPENIIKSKKSTASSSHEAPHSSSSKESFIKEIPENLSWEKIQNKKILIAESDMRISFSLSKELSSRGAIVLKATNFESILKTLKNASNENPINLLMVGHSSIKESEIAELKENQEYDHLPILLIADNISENEKQTFLKNGITAILEKPLDLALLLEKI